MASTNYTAHDRLKRVGLWADVIKSGKGYNFYLVHKNDERISNKLTHAELNAWVDGYVAAKYRKVP